MKYRGIILVGLVLSTLACKNCFNGDCDERLGICNQGCISGFFGRECKDKCPTNCIDSRCGLDENRREVCTIGCSPGFYGMTCRAPCLSTNTDNKCDRHTGKPPVCDGSKHGSHCELSCSCSGKACDNEGTCHESCRIGLFGEQCNKQCPTNCPMCKQQSGDCIVCKDGFKGDECHDKCVSAISSLQGSKYKSVTGCSISDSSVTTNDTMDLLMVGLISAIVFIQCVQIIVILSWRYKYKCCPRKEKSFNDFFEGKQTMIKPTFDEEGVNVQYYDH